ncbi:unnamed protein product [marine sediment metagenome]|uniref:Uncharacterized protein n=1 Tax=marine sediment metagenome TaxID=412755 RepID=X1J5E3_9ZZZZ
MAEEYATKKVEVAGQILCELIRKDIIPAELKRGMGASDFAEVYGLIYQGIWQAIDSAPKAKTK